jgi:hypothetical protein
VNFVAAEISSFAPFNTTTGRTRLNGAAQPNVGRWLDLGKSHIAAPLAEDLRDCLGVRYASLVAAPRVGAIRAPTIQRNVIAVPSSLCEGRG